MHPQDERRGADDAGTHQPSMSWDGQTEESSIISITRRMGGASCAKYPWSFYLQSINHFLQQPCIRNFATDVCSLRQGTFDQYSNSEGYGIVQASTTLHVLMIQVSERSFGL